MGFEFTFEKKGFTYGYNYQPSIDNFELKKYNAMDDDGCLEVRSPIFRYLEDVIEYYIQLKKDIGDTYIPKNPDSTGGGTHNHIGISNEIDGTLTKKDLIFRKNLLTLVWNRPWLTWAFQDPSDNGSSEPICLTNDSRYILNVNSERSLGGKSCSVRDDSEYDTVELRFFDTVTSEQELKYHILTSNYLVKLALTKKGESLNIDLNDDKLYEMLVSGEGLREFRKFKKEAGIVGFSESKIKECAEWAKESGLL
jgi:hypothetical protein